MNTFSASLFEFESGDILEVNAAEIFVDEFTVYLLSPEQFEKFREGLDSTDDEIVVHATRLVHLTKKRTSCKVEELPAGGWFAVYRDGQARGVQLIQRRTRSVVDGGRG